jgi:hypothetical protein
MATLDALRLRPCLVCGIQPTDIAHVKTRGSGGSDETHNLMALCRMHHSAQHQMGIVTFARKNWSVFEWLLQHGWELENGKLFHPKLLSSQVEESP